MPLECNIPVLHRVPCCVIWHLTQPFGQASDNLDLSVLRLADDEAEKGLGSLQTVQRLLPKPAPLSLWPIPDTEKSNLRDAKTPLLTSDDQAQNMSKEP